MSLSLSQNANLHTLFNVIDNAGSQVRTRETCPFGALICREESTLRTNP